MAIYESEDILQSAKAARPYLYHLIGEEAIALEEELDHLISRADRGEDVDNLILELFRKHDASREWMKSALEPGEEVLRKYTPLPGQPKPVPATTRFICQVQGCEFIWVRRHVRQGIPPCPQHNRDLEPAS